MNIHKSYVSYVGQGQIKKSDGGLVELKMYVVS